MRPKVFFLFTVNLCLSVFALAQPASDRDAFYQKADVTAYHGMEFRLQAAVKAQPTGNGEATLFVRIDNKGGKPGFYDNMNNHPIRKDKWETYKITGKIDDEALWLVYGGTCHKNGTYSFDDFQLEIKQPDGQWKKIVAENTGFEDGIGKWKFFYNTKGFRKNIVSTEAFEKSNYLQITVDVPSVYGDNDSTGHFIKANGIKIYYEEYGNGEPLLLLHGNSQSIHAFNKQIPEFAKQYHVIAVDTRGHGKTEDKDNKFSYDLFAEDMNALLNKLNLDSVNIVGWSDGGNTGLIMAMKYPTKVRKLVTMGAVVFSDSTVVSQKILDEIKTGTDELKDAKRPQDKNTLKKSRLLLDEPNYKFIDLTAIKCPVLVMAGEHDIIKIGHTKGIAANIPRAEMYIAPNQTHYFPQENAAEFNRIVMAFLEKK